MERLARAMVAADETMFGHGFDELSELSRESRVEHARAVAAEYHALGVETKEEGAADHEHYWVDAADDETGWHCTTCGVTEYPEPPFGAEAGAP